MDKNNLQKFKAILDNLLAKANNEDIFLSDKKQKVFLSYSDGAERAKTVFGTGNTLATAFSAAKNLAVKSIKDYNKLPKWVMINVVTNQFQSSVNEYYKMLMNTRRGYLRYGIAFDDMFNIAFLEQEIYGLNLIKYVKRHEQYFHEENITKYLRKSKGYKSSFSFKTDNSKPLILFETKSFFYDDGDYLELDSDTASLQKGIRTYDVVKEENPDALLSLTNKTADALVSTLNTDGSFVYGYYPCYSVVCAGYNVPRHALAVYSLADLYLLNREEKYKEAALLSLEYMIDTFVYHHDENTAFILDHINENETEIKLGALGMAILAITKCMEISEASYLPVLRKLGNGILYMQNKETGNYIHVLNYPDMALKDEFRIVYYAGEACFALTRLYTADRDQKWMDSIERAFDFFIKNDYHKYSDHWLAYAVNELALYKTDDKYFEFGLKNAFYDLDFIINRDTTWNTFLEMLNASFFAIKKMEELGKGYLLKPYDMGKLIHAMETRLNRQYASIMFPEMAMFFKFPEKILHGIFIRHHSFRVRNDDVAHHLMGYSNYYRIRFHAS